MVVLILLSTIGSVGAEEVNLNTLVFIVTNDEMVSFSDVQPVLIHGKPYVPMSFFTEVLGENIIWNELSQNLFIMKNNKILIVKVDKHAIPTESEDFPFDFFMRDGKVMASYKFVGQYLGYDFSFIPEGTIARIKNKNALLSDEEIYSKYKEMIEEKKQRLIEEEERKKVEAANAKKTIYLTFDDGPNQYTLKILDTLKEYHAKATFFMLEGNMKKNREIVKRIIEEGHAVGLHGVTHVKEKVYASTHSILNEMNIANNTLEKLTDQRTLLVRVPYGSKPYMKKEQLEALESWGYRMWDWNVDSGDSRKSNMPPDTIVDSTKAQINQIQKSQKTPVVLFHDLKTTSQALPTLLEYLNDNDYDIKPITPDLQPMNWWEN